MPLSRGSIYRFKYLWSREHDNLEVSGRKARPVCLVVRSASKPSVLFIFPITIRPPLAGTAALNIPPVECRRGGLSENCWIVVDEYNRLSDDELYDFESLRPIGAFSEGFMKTIARAIKTVSQATRVRAVPRS